MSRNLGSFTQVIHRMETNHATCGADRVPDRVQHGAKGRRFVNSFGCSRVIAVRPMKPLNRSRTGHIKVSCECLKVDADGVLPIVDSERVGSANLLPYRVEALAPKCGT